MNESQETSNQQTSESTTLQTTTSGKQRPQYKSKKTDSHVNKTTNLEQLDLDSLTHEDLLAEAKRLQSHLIQLKNIVNKTNCPVDDKKKWKNDRPFNFDKFNKRHVFIKFAYLGWNYQVGKELILLK